MQKHRILVIGSKDHKRADCVNWLEPFPNIEEFDSIIIDMQSLNQETYDKIVDRIRDMFDSISTILDTGREIFCILNSILTPSPPPIIPGKPRFKSIIFNVAPPINYDWLPARLDLDNKKSGDFISLQNPRFNDYFKLIHKWVFEISLFADSVRQTPYNYLNLIEPIAFNKSEKIIAGSLHRIIDRKKMLNGERFGLVHLLPPTDKDLMFQAIECIIDVIMGTEGKVVPSWRKDIDIPLDHELKNRVEKKIGEMKKIQGEIETLQQQIQSYDCYRDLLTETGKPLERIVQKTLEDIGIATKQTELGYPADLINNETAIEITGIKGCIGVDSGKVTQTNRYIQNFRKHNEKVVLVVNTYRDIEPKDRKGKMNFTPEMKKYLESLSISYFTTYSLYELWKDVILGKKTKEQVKGRILNAVNEVNP